MGLIKGIFELFVLYKVIFDFIIPLYKTSKQVSQKMGEMQNVMNEHLKKQPGGGEEKNSKDIPHKPSKEDYIEFEELR